MALRSEMQQRQLPTQALTDCQPNRRKRNPAACSAYSFVIRDFPSLFDVLYIIVIGGILSAVTGIDAERLGAAMTTVPFEPLTPRRDIDIKVFRSQDAQNNLDHRAFIPPLHFILFLLFR